MDANSMKAVTKQVGGAQFRPGQSGAQHSFEAQDKAAPLQRRCVALVILCLVLFGWRPAEAAWRGDVTSRGVAGADFAIADFDGDSRPDFARVQPGLAAASLTRYWIRFDFS